MTLDVSCICLTHGRPWLLAEAVESFRRQALGGLTAELIVVNDCAEQTLSCELAGVRIVQGMAQFPDCASKYNFAASLARGQWLAFWDDDDISLPRRLSWTLAQLERLPSAVVIRPLWIWHWANGTIRGRGGAMLCQALVRRDAWEQVGGAEVGRWFDQSAYFRLRKVGRYLELDEPPVEMHYIYRWAGVGYHDSGAGIEDAEERARAFHAEAVKDARFRTGAIRIEPQWTQDFEALAADAIRRELHKVRI